MYHGPAPSIARLFPAAQQNMPPDPRIALIHATSLAVEPIRQAFAAAWPQAQLANLLDDSLAADRARDGEITASMFARFSTLALYACDTGADAILFTCSAFGPAIERAALEVAVPVLKPNTAMFEAALARGTRIGLVVTFEPSAASLQAEFDAAARAAGSRAALDTLVVSGAMQALSDGDGASHDRMIAEACPALAVCDAVMLGQFSTARAAPAVRSALGIPVFTSPDAAVAKLRKLLARS